MLSVKKVSPLGFLILGFVVAEILVFVPSTTEELERTSFVIPSSQASFSIHGFHAVHLNQQGQKEVIKAKEAELFKKEGYSILKEVEIRIFSKGDHAFRITGNKGKYYMEKRDVELFDNILIVSENLGYEMTTDYLKYIASESLLLSDRNLYLSGPNPKNPSFVLTGRGLRADMEKEELNISDNVHCKKNDEGAEGIEIDSENAKIFLNLNEALFRSNVVVKQRDMNIFTDNFLVTFNSYNRSMDKAKAFDFVKIVQGDRIATCKTAFLLNREKKVVMRGQPKVMRGKDVIEAKIIIFFTAENKILFDEAIGEVDMERTKELN